MPTGVPVVFHAKQRKGCFRNMETGCASGIRRNRANSILAAR